MYEWWQNVADKWGKGVTTNGPHKLKLQPKIMIRYWGESSVTKGKVSWEREKLQEKLFEVNIKPVHYTHTHTHMHTKFTLNWLGACLCSLQLCLCFWVNTFVFIDVCRSIWRLTQFHLSSTSSVGNSIVYHMVIPNHLFKPLQVLFKTLIIYQKMWFQL